MSLSALLLGGKGKKIVDKDLDALFRSTVSAPPNNTPFASTGVTDDKKRKSELKHSRAHDKKSKIQQGEREEQVEPPEPDIKTSHGKGKSKAVVGDEDAPEHVEDQEKLLARKKYSKSKRHSDVDPISPSKSDAQENSDEDVDPSSTLVHESLLPTASKNKPSGNLRKIKFAPEGETPAQRNARTIFVGNLPLQVAHKRPLLKQLERHILSFVPTARIESSRFRSVAFQNPTTKLPADDDATQTKKSSTSESSGRPHDQQRSIAWRVNNKSTNTDTVHDEKKFLTPAQKKKVAFINGQFHPSADSVNAYIVFAHPVPASARPSNLPPPPHTMDPYEAACISVEKCHGTEFLGRTIRLDLVGKNIPDAASSSNDGAQTMTDPKLCIFVGNMDFESKEEDLRAFFESLVSSERGGRNENSSTDSGAGKNWVTRVRIIRDKDTLLGKGFAYVQFASRDCVDEILALDESRLKLDKRKLRVQRCKTLPGSSTASKVSSRKVTFAASLSTSKSPSTAKIPKGDPSLGSRLAGLSKEERKKIKSSDADRQARRIAKKKARMSLGNDLKVHGKERERVRKKLSTDKASGVTKKAGGKRVRSEKSMAKRNQKK